MNKIASKFLMTGDKFMPVLHLRQLGFVYITRVPFTKHCQKFKETGNLKHIYKNELDNACFFHDATYSDSKYLF